MKDFKNIFSITAFHPNPVRKFFLPFIAAVFGIFIVYTFFRVLPAYATVVSNVSENFSVTLLVGASSEDRVQPVTLSPSFFGSLTQALGVPFANAHSFFPENDQPWWLILLSTLANPGLTVAFFAFFLLALGYGFSVAGHRHLWRLFWHPHQHVFERVAVRFHDGTYLHAYSLFRKHASLSRHLTFASGLLLLMKVSVVAVTASFFFRIPQASVAVSQMTVQPGTILTYSLIYTNGGATSLSSITFFENIPEGVTYVAASATRDGAPLTDAADTDAAFFSADILTFALDSLASGAGGAFTWQVRADFPSSEEVITNSVTYEAAGFTRAETEEVTVRVFPLTVSGKVFHDVNKNGVLDAAVESALSGVRVSLYEDTNGNGVRDGSDDALSEVRSQAQGYYTFTGIRSGVYFVELNEATLPEGEYEATTKNPRHMTLASPESKTAQDFGFVLSIPEDVPGITLSGLVWNDVNRDGNLSARSEEFLPDVEVRLYRDSNENNILETVVDDFVQKAFTHSDGTYAFSGLAADRYFVSVHTESLPEGYTLTTNNVPALQRLSQADEQQELRFGFSLPTSVIGDEVFEDSNNNTLHDPHEAGFGNVKILLYQDSDGSDALTPNTDHLLRTRTTNAEGRYAFDQLAAGTYFVVVDVSTLPSFYEKLTTPNHPYLVELETDNGQEYLLADFGFRSTQAVSEPASVEIFMGGADDTDADINDSDAHNEGAGDADSASSASEDVISPTESSETADANVASQTDAALRGYLSQLTAEVASEVSVLAPTLTHINFTPLGQSGEYHALERVLVLEGFADPSSLVTLQIFSEEPLTYVVKTNDEGHWAVAMDVLLLGIGEYRVLAQTKNQNGVSDVAYLATLKVQRSTQEDSVVLFFIMMLLCAAVTLFFLVFRRPRRMRK